MITEHRMSVNIAVLEAKDFWVTVAAWQPDADDYPSYEIGVRSKVNKTFKLIQHRGWDEWRAKIAGNAVCVLLDAGFSVDQIQAVLE